MKRVEQIKYHWAQGIHNEIPKCCIVWFIIRYQIGIVYIICRSTTLKRLWDWSVRKYTRERENDYIHCAICALRRRSIRLHDCDAPHGCTRVDSNN